MKPKYRPNHVLYFKYQILESLSIHIYGKCVIHKMIDVMIFEIDET